MFKGAPPCHICNKRVYPMEKVVADEKVFHKTCLKCKTCQKTVSLGNYAALNGVFYCKPHFKQLFAAKGNYSTGFGEKDPKAKWQTNNFGVATSSSSSSSSAPTSFVSLSPSGRGPSFSSSSSSSSISPSPMEVVSPGRLRMERVQSVRFTPTQKTDYEAKLPLHREADDALDLQNKKTLTPDAGTSLESPRSSPATSSLSATPSTPPISSSSPPTTPTFNTAPKIKVKEREKEKKRERQEEKERVKRLEERLKELERENEKLRTENTELKGDLKENEKLLSNKTESFVQMEKKVGDLEQKLMESARKEGDNSLVSKIDDFKDENGQLNKKIEGLVQENAQKEKELTEEREKRGAVEKDNKVLKDKNVYLETKCQKIEESLVLVLGELKAVQCKLSNVASTPSTNPSPSVPPLSIPCPSLSPSPSPSPSPSTGTVKRSKKVGGLAALFEQKALEKENDAKRASLRIPSFRKK